MNKMLSANEELKAILSANQGADGTLVISKNHAERLLQEALDKEVLRPVFANHLSQIMPYQQSLLDRVKAAEAELVLAVRDAKAQTPTSGIGQGLTDSYRWLNKGLDDVQLGVMAIVRGICRPKE